MTQQEFKDYILDRDCMLTLEDCMFLMKDCPFVRQMTHVNISEDIYEIIFEDMSSLRFKPIKR